MQHIINIAFDFDDDKVKAIAEKTIEQDMDSIIKEIILDSVAPRQYSYLTNKRERNWEGLSNKVTIRIDAVLKEYKDEIIELAASKLADSFKRTKAWKERIEKLKEEGEEE